MWTLLIFADLVTYIMFVVYSMFICTLHGNALVQVAMGQEQATVAIQLLRECASKGHWLCLKNLHLVTSWLPTLEKVRMCIKHAYT